MIKWASESLFNSDIWCRVYIFCECVREAESLIKADLPPGVRYRFLGRTKAYYYLLQLLWAHSKDIAEHYKNLHKEKELTEDQVSISMTKLEKEKRERLLIDYSRFVVRYCVRIKKIY